MKKLLKRVISLLLIFLMVTNVISQFSPDWRVQTYATSSDIITTVAGTDTQGYFGDDAPAINANLNSPHGVAVDSQGNLYIADTYNHRIRKVSATDGVISTVVGTGTSGYSGDGEAATLANLSSPNGVALDSSGNLYIADTMNHVIRKVATDGKISTVAGTNTGDDLDDYYGGYSGDGGLATSAELRAPRGLAVDNLSNLYIADSSNNRIRKVSATDGVITTVAGTGSYSYSGDGGLANQAGLNFPRGVAVDSHGNLYIADRSNHRIRKVSATDGVITTVAGTGTPDYSGDGEAATSANLKSPHGVAVDSHGNLYIADTENNRIRKVSAADGVISTVAGTGIYGYSGDEGTATLAQFRSIYGVIVDSNGNLYITDSNNNRIRKVTVPTVSVTGVTVDPSTLTLIEGGAPVSLTATVSPIDATNKGVVWSSSNTAIATVSSSGEVTPVGVGTATITVTTQDGSNTGTVEVTVNALVNAETPTIVTQPIGTTVNEGATSPVLSVVASVSDGGTLSYQWNSNSTNSTIGGTIITGATSASYSAPTSTVGTMYYYVVVTNTKSGVNGTTTETASNVVAVVVSPTLPAYTVTYNGNGNTGGSVPIDSELYEQGAPVTVQSNNGSLAKTGYTFAGWNTAADGSGTNYVAGATFPIGTANVTLYAKWTAIPSSSGSGGSVTPSQTGSQVTTIPAPQVITVPVQTGNVGSGSTVSETPITRTIDPEGKVKDEVTLNQEKMKDTVQSIIEANQSTARIMIQDTKDEVGQVNINVPKEATKEIGDKNINLEIFTENVRIIIPHGSMDNFLNDLFFRVIPIKEESQRKEVESRARVEQIVKEVANNDNIAVISRPMTIETNMQGRPTTLVLPLRDLEVPTNDAERSKFLNELFIFIEHSDGEKRLEKGKNVEYKEGQLGIEFGVNKFSTFTILHLEGFAQNFHQAYIKGFTDGSFKPNEQITRTQMALMLARILGYDETQKATKAPFRDVSVAHPTSGAIACMQEKGLMTGDDNGNFNPSEQITRAQMAVVVARYKQLSIKEQTINNNAFSDIIGHWAIKEIAANKDAGIITGFTDGTFRPQSALTRAQAVKIINRMFDRGPLFGVATPRFKDVPATHWAFEEIEEAAQDHFFTSRAEGGENLVK
ncbi:hypothetical protein BHU72_09865 [Desulfuribacillus stibiiarsenatis]|uniref:SLH domain-containing protein n=1 Tax=Desulfuribacillus stibiiarsenatis TaxID=1390249 RepID=A0A1E5L304_9FIRM|nr:S-layer homology domain-containing protein [Desulfuribacillus stibiiarsenatis]OEH84502.1 hypothetical protein BHU72_09865 [Desulfuribacillus stibiiarsenatis]